MGVAHYRLKSVDYVPLSLYVQPGLFRALNLFLPDVGVGGDRSAGHGTADGIGERRVANRCRAENSQDGATGGGGPT